MGRPPARHSFTCSQVEVYLLKQETPHAEERAPTRGRARLEVWATGALDFFSDAAPQSGQGVGRSPTILRKPPSWSDRCDPAFQADAKATDPLASWFALAA